SQRSPHGPGRDAASQTPVLAQGCFGSKPESLFVGRTSASAECGHREETGGSPPRARRSPPHPSLPRLRGREGWRNGQSGGLPQRSLRFCPAQVVKNCKCASHRKIACLLIERIGRAAHHVAVEHARKDMQLDVLRACG